VGEEGKEDSYHPCMKKERLLILLAELQSSVGMKRAEQFHWFTENSSSGENCGYARKALDSFYSKYYSEISSLLRDIIGLMEEIDGSIQKR